MQRKTQNNISRSSQKDMSTKEITEYDFGQNETAEKNTLPTT